MGVSHCSPETPECRVSASNHAVRRYLLTFVGMAVFLLLIAGTGVVATYLYGIGGLAIGVGLFLIALCVTARSEGVL